MSNGSGFAIVTEWASTACPTCHGKLDLLAHDTDHSLPAFLLCWKCHQVSQVGAGEVKEFAPLERR